MKFKVGDRVKTKLGNGNITAISRGEKTTLIDVVGNGINAPFWDYELKPVFSSKSIRRELKSLKSDLRQLAADACYRDRAWGEQIDRMADRVGEMVEKV